MLFWKFSHNFFIIKWKQWTVPSTVLVLLRFPSYLKHCVFAPICLNLVKFNDVSIFLQWQLFRTLNLFKIRCKQNVLSHRKTWAHHFYSSRFTNIILLSFFFLVVRISFIVSQTMITIILLLFFQNIIIKRIPFSCHRLLAKIYRNRLTINPLSSTKGLDYSLEGRFRRHVSGLYYAYCQ